MIATLLGWTKLPQWALDLIVVALVAGGIWYWQHHLIDEGVKKQKATDAVESQKLLAEAKNETLELKAKATMAEQTHAKEIADLQKFHDDHPNGPVRLCLAAPGGKSVRPAGGANSGNEATGASTASVQPVPGGDTSSGAGTAGPDIEPMLTALGTAADKVSATLREFQAR